MNSKILNYKGEVVYECAGSVGYDHGYWVRIYSLLDTIAFNGLP